MHDQLFVEEAGDLGAGGVSMVVGPHAFIRDVTSHGSLDLMHIRLQQRIVHVDGTVLGLVDV